MWHQHFTWENIAFNMLYTLFPFQLSLSAAAGMGVKGLTGIHCLCSSNIVCFFKMS